MKDGSDMMALILGLLVGWLVMCVILAIVETRPPRASMIIVEMPSESAPPYVPFSALPPPLAS
jgi:hypothetical protein